MNRPFKNHLKQLYSKWLLARGHVLTLPGELRDPVCNCCASRSRPWQLPLQKRVSKDLKSEAYLMTWMEWNMMKLGIFTVNMRHEMRTVKTMKLK
jgi:hypothetical protein